MIPSDHIFTLGIEEEFAIVDPETRELRSHIQEILEGGNSYNINVFRVSLEGHPRYRESGPYEEAAWAPLNDLRSAGLSMPPQLLDALVAANEGNKS